MCKINSIIIYLDSVLVFFGGGVRVVYQVGVLKVIVDIMLEFICNLFGIICGIFVGVINVIVFVVGVDNFCNVVYNIENVWCLFYLVQVYCLDLVGVFSYGLCWVLSVVLGF